MATTTPGKSRRQRVPAAERRDALIEAAVHEFAHGVSLHVNPRFGNNPRWLWEAVAIYEQADPDALAA